MAFQRLHPGTWKAAGMVPHPSPPPPAGRANCAGRLAAMMTGSRPFREIPLTTSV